MPYELNTPTAAIFGGSGSAYAPGSRGKYLGPGKSRTTANAGSTVNPLEGLLKATGLGNVPGHGGTTTAGGAKPGKNTGVVGPGPTPGGSTGGIPNFSVAAQKNPEFSALTQAYEQYRSGLSAGNDLDAQMAMQRQRDLMSGLAKEYQGEAAARGILNSGIAQQGMLDKIINPGQQVIGQLNANLTSDARRQQLTALGGQAGVAGQQANFLQGQQQLGLEAWKSQQQHEIDRAGIQAMQQNQSVNQLLALIGTLGSFYTGF